MPIARSSVRSAAADVRARIAVIAMALLLATAGASPAQQPTLRVGGSDVRGVVIDGAPLFSSVTLERLGFRLGRSATDLTAVLGTDTIRFFDTSPYFRARGGMHQLTYPARIHQGVMHLPEQFFIQWLPNAFPERFAFRSGALSIRPGGSTSVVARTSTADTARAQRSSAAQPAAPPKPESASANARVVVIDPGHGGRDPGKVGPDGLAEKDVALRIAQRLAATLKDRGYEVHLTRTNDTYIPLQERPRMANRWKGERPVALFLSIHANSAPSTAAKGFETFFLSEARTDDERRVAEMENEAINFDDHPPAAAEAGLDQILNTLRSDFLMRASHDLAAVVQDRLATFHPGPNRGVKRAGFYVLVGAIMPAVLIETAFISNRDEARLLGTQDFQQKIALGIADSVDEFFRRNEHLWVQ